MKKGFKEFLELNLFDQEQTFIEVIDDFSLKDIQLNKNGQ